MAGVLAASLFAQYPMDDSRDYVFTKEELPSFSPPDYARIRSEFISDRDFVQQVERLLPRGAMVYQFPYHKFPESGHIGHMFEYQLFTGFLHSKELRWSYGGMKGRPGDGWHQDVAALPLPERISRLREAGFAGIYVDCRAYDADAWKDFASQMGTLLGEEPLMSKNGNLAFWRL